MSTCPILSVTERLQTFAYLAFIGSHSSVYLGCFQEVCPPHHHATCKAKLHGQGSRENNHGNTVPERGIWCQGNARWKPISISSSKTLVYIIGTMYRYSPPDIAQMGFPASPQHVSHCVHDRRSSSPMSANQSLARKLDAGSTLQTTPRWLHRVTDSAAFPATQFTSPPNSPP